VRHQEPRLSGSSTPGGFSTSCSRRRSRTSRCSSCASRSLRGLP